ncbi:hypothetical protein C5167_048732 [Papaver somniferum]|uniref:Retinoblastoma-associated protein N-terminal domain-containing protein n=1 Tax=Papaver somniferum TaxID=3469 RepID=A0A4Y7KM56_PAPSO|nr:hypothetical protein C5167_048732 [Papaver somniferum]
MNGKQSAVAYDNKESAVASKAVPVSYYRHFGWLLFLALRAHAVSRFKDPVTCTNGLVPILYCQVNYVHISECIEPERKFFSWETAEISPPTAGT